MKRICFIGASTVEGLGDETGQGWVGRLTAARRNQGKPYIPFYLGVRGQTLQQIADRAHQECKVRITSKSNDLIVLGTGVNDIARVDSKPRTKSEDVLNTFAQLIDTLTGLSKLIVVGPFPVHEPKMPFYSSVTDLNLCFQNNDIREISKAYGEKCESKGIPYLNLFGDLLICDDYQKGLKLGDGLHSNSDGYHAVADLVENWSPWKIYSE
jgi:lysophospholipase L1-like esterase